MAIAIAEQRGPNVYVFDENNQQLFILQTCELVSFTSETVSTRPLPGSGTKHIYIYDKTGHLKTMHQVNY